MLRVRFWKLNKRELKDLLIKNYGYSKKELKGHSKEYILQLLMRERRESEAQRRIKAIKQFERGLENEN